MRIPLAIHEHVSKIMKKDSAEGPHTKWHQRILVKRTSTSSRTKRQISPGVYSCGHQVRLKTNPNMNSVPKSGF